MITIFFVALLFVFSTGCADDEARRNALAASLRQEVDRGKLALPFASPDEARELAELRRHFYEARGFSLAWLEKKISPATEELVEAIGTAPTHGLDPARYGVDTLTRHLAELEETSVDDAPVERVALVDAALTASYLRFAADLTAGAARVGVRKLGWAEPKLPDDFLAKANAAIGSGVGPALAELAARHPDYERTRTELARHREITAGGWPAVPMPASKNPDEQWLAALRARLAASGDLADANNSEAETLAQAYRAFQARHGVDPDGVYDERSIAALNVAAPDRVRQLELALERLRWLGPDLGDRYLLVNVPAFHLDVIENGELRLDMRVAVGKPDWPTPTLDSAIERVVVNPRWNVPKDIAIQEVLPEVAADPEKAESDGIVVLDDDPQNPKVVQQPGPKNPLGRIQFLFPNPYAVYLHDTPSGKVFARDNRGVSHGCVRVAKPLELAELLLAPDGWDAARLQAAIDSGKRDGVKVPSPLPIHIVYWTAWVDRGGVAQFRDDLYGNDVKLAELLAPGSAKTAGGPPAHKPSRTRPSA